MSSWPTAWKIMMTVLRSIQTFQSGNGPGSRNYLVGGSCNKYQRKYKQSWKWKYIESGDCWVSRNCLERSCNAAQVTESHCSRSHIHGLQCTSFYLYCIRISQHKQIRLHKNAPLVTIGAFSVLSKARINQILVKVSLRLSGSLLCLISSVQSPRTTLPPAFSKLCDHFFAPSIPTSACTTTPPLDVAWLNTLNSWTL